MRLRHRILALLLGFSVVAVVAADLAQRSGLRASIPSLVRERLEVESELIAGEARADLLAEGADAHAVARRLGSRLGARVTLFDRDGAVIADSRVPAGDGAAPGIERDSPEVREALRRGTGISTRFDAEEGESVSYFARVVHGADGRALCLRLGVGIGALEDEGSASRLRADLALLAILAGLVALVHVLTRRALEPLHRMAQAADDVARGDSARSLSGSGNGHELTALGSSLDRMRRALLARIAGLVEEQKVRDTVLSGMSEGLLVVDVSRRVLLANAAIRRAMALGEGDLTGRSLAEVVRDPDVGGAFARTLAERREHRCRVDIDLPAERTFELLVEPLVGEDGAPLGAIGLFVDVTRLQALERIRSTFVSDLSHEVRTPLASIGAAVETLADGEDMTAEGRARFLAILKRNVERIRVLLEELTDLSRIETGSVRLELETLAPEDCVREVLASLAGMAEPGGLSLTMDVPSDLRMRADRRRLDQILMNVVENAIKFNRPSGQVHVSARTVDGGIRMRVEDTGEGIPEAEREKIFMRFYRVDRSRTREAGGRGLGLAIVKHLVRLHGGSVSAEERPGGGTAIVLTFPASGPAPDAAPSS